MLSTCFYFHMHVFYMPDFILHYVLFSHGLSILSAHGFFFCIFTWSFHIIFLNVFFDMLFSVWCFHIVNYFHLNFLSTLFFYTWYLFCCRVFFHISNFFDIIFYVFSCFSHAFFVLFYFIWHVDFSHVVYLYVVFSFICIFFPHG